MKEKSKYGKKKIDIKKIRDDGTRRVCLNKRMRGIIKKQIEISVLCGIEYLSFARDPYTGNIFVYSNLVQPQNFLDDVLIQANQKVSHIRSFTPESYSEGIGDLHKIPVEGIMLRNKSGRPRKYVVTEDNSDLDEEPADDDTIVERATIRLMNNLKKEKYETTNMLDENRVYVPKKGLTPIKREPYAKQSRKIMSSGEHKHTNRTRRNQSAQKELLVEFNSPITTTPPTPVIDELIEYEIPRLVDEQDSKEEVWSQLKEAATNMSKFGAYMKGKWLQTNIKVEVVKVEQKVDQLLEDPLMDREFNEIAEMLNLNCPGSEPFCITNYPWMDTLNFASF